MKEFAYYLILNSLVFILGIIAFRNRYHAVPAKSVFPVVLVCCVLSLLPCVLILGIRRDLYDALPAMISSGVSIFLFWVWTTLEILIKNIRKSTFSKIMSDSMQTIILILIPLVMWLWLVSIPFGKIGG